MALGGVLGSLLGGIALSNLEISNIFLLYSAFPAIQLFSCAFVSEFSSVTEKTALKEKVENISNSSSIVGITKAHQRKGENRQVSKGMEAMEVKDYSSSSKWFISLRSTAQSLFNSFKQPIVHRYFIYFQYDYIFL